MSKIYEALEPELLALEGERQATMAKIVAITGATGVGLFALGHFVLAERAVLLVFLFWTGLVGWGSHKVFAKKFGETFKSRVITKLVARVDPSLQYHPTGGLGSASFDVCRLYPGTYSRFHAEDLVFGRVADTEFGFCELDVSRGAGDSYVQVFKGLFFEFALAAPLAARVTLRPPAGAFAKLSRSVEGRGAKPPGARMAFDEPAFDEAFEVYTEDEALARQLLSAPTRKRLLAFRQKADAPVSLAFIGDKCYLGIEKKQDQFEPRIFRTLLDPRPIQAFIETLQFVTGVVRDLNPNAAARRAGA